MKKLFFLSLLFFCSISQNIAAQTNDTPSRAYGFRVYDDAHRNLSLISFSVDSPDDITDEATHGLTYLRAAAFDGRRYYIMDSDDGMVASRFISFDKDRNDVDTIITYGMTDIEGGMLFLDMAYDASADQLYGVAFSIGEGTVDGDNIDVPLNLYTIDRSSGRCTRVGTQNTLYVTAIAFSPEGTLFAMVSDGSLWQLNKSDFQAGQRLCSTRIVTTGLQSMAFDDKSGLLYWTAITESGHGFLGSFSINGSTATYNEVGATANNTEVTGLTIESNPPSRLAPAAVSALKATAGESGAKRASLSWVNPTTLMNKEIIAGTFSVRIHRNGSLVAELTGQEPGAEASYTDEGAEGFIEYSVVAVNAAGEGRMSYADSVFVGVDVPGHVRNLTAERSTDAYDIVVQWDAPVKGKRGGWFDASQLRYDIVRLPDNVKVTTGLTANTFTDKTITQPNAYSYRVTAVTDAGSGPATESNFAYSGPAIELPYTCTFDTDNAIASWTVVDEDADGYRWTPASDRDDTFMKYFPADILNPDTTASDWLISAPIRFEAGKHYRLHWSLRTQGPLYPVSIRSTLGLANASRDSYRTLQQLDHEVIDVQGSFVDEETIVQVDATGDYVVGFQALNPVSMHITNVVIEELPAVDMAAISLAGTDMPLAGQAATYSVGVRNCGFNAIDSYEVQLLNTDDGSLLATATGDALAAQQQATVNIRWTPQQADSYTLQARVVAKGDAHADNDLSPTLAVNVIESGTWADLTAGRSFTNDAPFDLQQSHGAVQTIYQKDSLQAIPEGALITGMKYHYTVNGNDFPGPFNAKVYLANTELTQFPDGSMVFLPEDNFTLVFDGTLSPSREQNELGITFDAPFSYTGNGICVYTQHETANIGSSLWWRIYYKGTDESHRTLYYQGTSAYDGSQELNASQEYPNVSFFFSGVDGIKIIDESPSAVGKNAGIYDLQGRKVDDVSGRHGSLPLQLPKGIYIVNGRKVVMK